MEVSRCAEASGGGSLEPDGVVGGAIRLVWRVVPWGVRILLPGGASSPDGMPVPGTLSCPGWAEYRAGG